MFQSILNTINNCATIWKNEKNLHDKIEVLSTFGKLSVNLVFNKEKTHERIFNQKMTFFTYDVLFWLFYEIFIKKEYWFEAKTTTPYIIDCGSNIGMSILFFKKHYPNAEIIGFEPDKETFQLLKQNIVINKWKNITVHQEALSNKTGYVPFYKDAATEGKLGMSITKQVEEHNMAGIKQTTVKAVPLSSYITKNVDFMKLDVEGAEMQVLEDLDKTKKIKHIKEMVVEYHYSKKNPENKLITILEILEKNKFKYFFVAEQEIPFFRQQKKPYSLLIYAYRVRA